VRGYDVASLLQTYEQRSISGCSECNYKEDEESEKTKEVVKKAHWFASANLVIHLDLSVSMSLQSSICTK